MSRMSSRRLGAKWDKAFTADETDAVHTGLAKLYTRSLAHLVAPKFDIPYLPKVCHDLIDISVWNRFDEVRRVTGWDDENVGFSYLSLDTSVPIGKVATLEMNSNATFIPKWDCLLDDQKHLENLPAVLAEYAIAAIKCRHEWMKIYATFTELNSVTKRATAAYYWPCASALMALGGRSRPELTAVQRPGNIPGGLVEQLRDTSAFVMQYSLLPPLDNTATVDYQGDPEKGIAAQLMLTDADAYFTAIVWPIKDR